MQDCVECRSEFVHAEKPVALTWDGERLEITAILNRWRFPGGRGFRVETGDGQVFELVYSENEDEWRIQQP
jgi:hypothetical protein